MPDMVVLDSSKSWGDKSSSSIWILKQIHFDFLQLPIVLVNILSPDLANDLGTSLKQKSMFTS